LRIGVSSSGTIAVIRYDEATAAAAELPDPGAEFSGAVYYPFLHFSATYRLPGFLARREFRATCLVDARRGFAATADSFDVQEELVAEADVLDVRVPADTAENAARRYLSHALGRRLKAIADFGIETRYRGVVYKKFRVISIAEQRFIVDSVTGAIHPLPRAARDRSPVTTSRFKNRSNNANIQIARRTHVGATLESR
jgi:hypothetical protein